MPRIPIIKAKDFYSYLLKYGCTDVSIKGSHHKVCYPLTNKVSAVTVHAGKNFDKGSFAGVLKQLGIDIEDFINFIS